MLGGNMSQIKPGDRVVRIKEYRHYELPKYSRGAACSSVDLMDGTVMVKFDDYSAKPVGSFIRNLIPESLFDSPLYQALL
jgi:hypothetical protein